jgi:alkaline phosphatase
MCYIFVKLIFAGGRKKFMRKTDPDYANSTKFGDRIDNRNLIDDWHRNMQSKQLKHKFLWNISDFEQLKKSDQHYDHILGLLAYNNMEYETERVEQNPPKEPSLVEMTEAAIRILSRNPRGFFLLVEGGKIDHGHHIGNAQRALNDYVVFDEAIGEALYLTRENDTLIVVTADHSHVFTMGGKDPIELYVYYH